MRLEGDVAEGALLRVAEYLHHPAWLAGEPEGRCHFQMGTES